MIITIFGPPGSGKGTQSYLLITKYDLKLISVGSLLRSIISSNNELSKKIKNTVESGNLVQDQVICELLYDQLASVEDNFLLDGFPRNLSQAHFLTQALLDRYNRDVDIVIELQLDDETAINRLKNRLVCLECKTVYSKLFLKKGESSICIRCKSVSLKRRIDDSNLPAIKKRIKEYHIQIKNLREHYKDKLLTINASSNVDYVRQEIESKISQFSLTLNCFML